MRTYDEDRKQGQMLQPEEDFLQELLIDNLKYYKMKRKDYFNYIFR